LWRMVTGRSTDTRRCLLFSITPPFYTPESADARAFNYAIGISEKKLLKKRRSRLFLSNPERSEGSHGSLGIATAPLGPRNDKGLLQFILPWM
jgi:hypothetical protein